jgi:lipopolysaccharide transport system ATP-binding protein
MLLGGQKVLDGTPKDVVNLYEKFGESKHDSIATIQKEFKALQENATKPLIAKPQTLSSYNPNLVSKSMVVYEEKGARIFDIEIVDTHNNKVNVLEYGEVYQYSYKIQYFDTFDNVKIAMQLKDVSGLHLGGKVVPLKDYNIPKVNKNEILHIRWKFKNILNANTYFLNCGTSNTEYGEKEVLHRVIDAYMFKVVKDDNYSNGFVDFGFDLSISK